MPGGQHGVPPVLLPQLPPGPALQGEGGGVHEPPQVEILLEVRYPVFHLVLIKVGLHKRDLYVGLRGKGGGRGDGLVCKPPPGGTGEAGWDTAPCSAPVCAPEPQKLSAWGQTSALPALHPQGDRGLWVRRTGQRARGTSGLQAAPPS